MAYSAVDYECGPKWTKEEFEAKILEMYEKRLRNEKCEWKRDEVVVQSDEE